VTTSVSKGQNYMQTLTSAKRVIRFLIWLNLVTILTSVTIISSGMFVANASKKPTTNCITNKVNFITLKPDHAYTGTFRSTSLDNKVIANVSLTFTGVFPTKSDPGKLDGVSFHADATSSGGTFTFVSIDASTLDPGGPQTLNDFTLNITSEKGGLIHFTDDGGSSGNGHIIGTFSIDGGGPDQGANGGFDIH
jgi:hypothetical protein